MKIFTIYHNPAQICRFFKTKPVIFEIEYRNFFYYVRSIGLVRKRKGILFTTFRTKNIMEHKRLLVLINFLLPFCYLEVLSPAPNDK